MLALLSLLITRNLTRTKAFLEPPKNFPVCPSQEYYENLGLTIKCIRHALYNTRSLSETHLLTLEVHIKTYNLFDVLLVT